MSYLLRVMVQLMFFILFTYSSVSCYQQIVQDDENGYAINIKVNQETGDDKSCLKGDNPCATLNKALEVLNNRSYSSAAIYVSPGNYTLEHEGDANGIIGMDIAIIGSGETNTIINCKPYAGLHISNCNGASIKNISFHGCGHDAGINNVVMKYDHQFVHSDQHFYEYESKLSMLPSALSFTHSSQITINSVTINSSKGTGLLFYESSDPIIITDTTISNGYGELEVTQIYSSNEFRVGGGIVIISAFDCETANSYVKISNSYIVNNSYPVTNPYRSDCISPSGGAALTLINPCGYPSVHVDSCTITDNNRGLFVYVNNASSLMNHEFNNLISQNLHSNIYFKDDYGTNQVNKLTFTDVYMTEDLNIIYSYYRHDVNVSNRNSQIHVIHSRNEICSNESDITPGSCVNSSNTVTDQYMLYNYTNPFICPVSYSVCFDQRQIICSCYDNHDGLLCGQCIEGHSVAINSPYLECVPCDNWMTVLKGWGLLILLEFIPVTVMVAVIAVLNVNLNQGSLKAYIFFCQILTIPIPSVSYPPWLVTLFNFNRRIIDLAFLPFSIWNLGFINYPSCNLFDISNHCHSMSICISTTTTPLGAIVFWYVIGFYPFLLLALSYACIIMYDRGYRCIVGVVRPAHRLLARFWRMFNIQPSLPHTIASVYTLCFTQLAATSLKLLTPTWNNGLAFFYDGSQRYFSGWHGAAGTLALIVLIVFIIIPTVYLTVYPFKWFQHFFNKLHFKKDLLISVTDAFTGPYKDGTDNNSWDYRYFTGLHFLLNILIMCTYCMPRINFLLTPLTNLVFCLLSFMLLMVFRPLKRNIHVFVEMLLFACFGVFCCLNFSALYHIINNNLEATISAMRFQQIDNWTYVLCCVMYVGLFIVSCYCLFWLLKKSKTGILYIYRLQPRPTPAIINNYMDSDNDITDDMFADRLLSPQLYGNQESEPVLQSSKVLWRSVTS